MTHDELVKAIRNRGEKQTSFNRGILTADRYLKTLLDCAGSDLCYRYAATKRHSFDDLLRKAASQLTYNNEEMKTDEVVDTKAAKLPDGVELPKNALMVMRHVLTTPKKDRDGDILRTEGATVDPKMLLLWQHVSTLPIGKMLYIQNHSSRQLMVVSAIVDLNELAHDAAVMVDNDMARYSHGFKALEWKEITEDDLVTGFDIKKYEIMEESLVSVPSNTDAENREIMLGLVEGGKLTSPLMKEFGKSIRNSRTNRSVQVGMPDLDEKENDDEERTEQATPEGSEDPEGKSCGCGKAAASTEAEGDEGIRTEDTPTDEKRVTTEDTKGYFYGDLEGSWEWIRCHLQKQARRHLIRAGIDVDDDEFVGVMATYSDHVILCCGSYYYGDDYKYFKAEWSHTDKGPVLDGEVKEVEIEQTVVAKTTEMFTKGFFQKDAFEKSPAKHAPEEIPIAELASNFLVRSSDSEKESLRRALEVLHEIEQKKKRNSEIRSLVGS